MPPGYEGTEKGGRDTHCTPAKIILEYICSSSIIDGIISKLISSAGVTSYVNLQNNKNKGLYILDHILRDPINLLLQPHIRQSMR